MNMQKTKMDFRFMGYSMNPQTSKKSKTKYKYFYQLFCKNDKALSKVDIHIKPVFDFSKKCVCNAITVRLYFRKLYHGQDVPI